jgi:hypothetical protein
MEEISETESIDQKPKRSSFLTVLCVLTFIGSTYGLVDSIRGFGQNKSSDNDMADANEKMDEALDQLEEAGSSEGMISFLEGFRDQINNDLTDENLRKISIGRIISNFLTLFAAFMMWQLRRWAYFIYMGGIAILIAVPITVLGGSLGWMMGIGVGIGGIIMIILFGANLRQMS